MPENKPRVPAIPANPAGFKPNEHSSFHLRLQAFNARREQATRVEGAVKSKAKPENPPVVAPAKPAAKKPAAKPAPAPAPKAETKPAEAPEPAKK